MSTVFRPVPTSAKWQEIEKTLTGYWEKDKWDITDPIFDEFRPQGWFLQHRTKIIDFSCLQSGIKEEVKFFIICRLREHTMRLHTVVNYVACFARLADFLKRAYPMIRSFTGLEIKKAMTRWRSYLVEQKLPVNKKDRTSRYESLLRQVYQFIVNFYDDREEFTKNVWDMRKIPGAKYTQNRADYLLSFENIPLPFRSLAKRYLKARVGVRSYVQCAKDLMALRLFLRFIHEQYPHWQDLKSLSRKDIENYLVWYRLYTKDWQKQHRECLISLRVFLIISSGPSILRRQKNHTLHCCSRKIFRS